MPVVNYRMTAAITTLVQAAEMFNSMPNIPWRFTWDWVTGKHGVAFARNCLVQKFFETDAKRIWFLDYDVIPKPNAFELLLVKGDITAGLYPAFYGRKHEERTGQEEPAIFYGAYNLKDNSGQFPVYRHAELPENGNPIIKVDACMMGNAVIRREVLEDKRMWKGEQDDPEAPPIFHEVRALNGRLNQTEDLDFCYRAKQLGYEVAVHSGIKFGHVKDMNLETLVDAKDFGMRVGLIAADDLNIKPDIEVVKH